MKMDVVLQHLNAIEALVNSLKQELSAVETPKAPEVQQNGFKCPECGGEMILRINRQQGNKFWGCRKFPGCKGTRDEDGLSKAEKEEMRYKKEQSEQQSGFSFNRAKRNPVTEVEPPKSNWNPFEK